MRISPKTNLRDNIASFNKAFFITSHLFNQGNNLKRRVCVLLAIATLTACGGGNSNSGSGSDAIPLPIPIPDPVILPSPSLTLSAGQTYRQKS